MDTELPLLDEQGNPIREEDCDLKNGYIYEGVYVPPEAYDTIDNVTKFALYDDDYIHCRMYHPYNDMDRQAMEQAERQERTNYEIDKLPSVQQSQDKAIIMLYEMINPE